MLIAEPPRNFEKEKTVTPNPNQSKTMFTLPSLHNITGNIQNIQKEDPKSALIRRSNLVMMPMIPEQASLKCTVIPQSAVLRVPPSILPIQN